MKMYYFYFHINIQKISKRQNEDADISSKKQFIGTECVKYLSSSKKVNNIKIIINAIFSLLKLIKMHIIDIQIDHLIQEK